MIWLSLLMFWVMLAIAVFALAAKNPNAVFWACVGMVVVIWVMWRETKGVNIR